MSCPGRDNERIAYPVMLSCMSTDAEITPSSRPTSVARSTPVRGDYEVVEGWWLHAAEDGQLDAATAASLAGSESNVESSSKDGGMAGADTASISD